MKPIEQYHGPLGQLRDFILTGYDVAYVQMEYSGKRAFVLSRGCMFPSELPTTADCIASIVVDPVNQNVCDVVVHLSGISVDLQLGDPCNGHPSPGAREVLTFRNWNLGTVMNWITEHHAAAELVVFSDFARSACISKFHDNHWNGATRPTNVSAACSHVWYQPLRDDKDIPKFYVELMAR